jgi:hypothetical protein
MMTIFKIIKKWLPLAAVTVGLSMLVYLAVQQSLRMGANDPQIQLAEDAALSLNAGGSVESVVPAAKVEISSSLAPFIVVFDDAGNVVASSATLHGSIPTYPSGVLGYTRQNGEDRVTWQPESGVRMATVVVQYDKGFVMAGRSLLEVENRTTNLEKICIAAMLAVLAVTLVLIVLGELLTPKKIA